MLACIVVCIGIYIFGGAIYKDFTTTALAKRFPPSATDIHDYEWDEPGELSQDYCILVTAKLPKSELPVYAAQEGLRLITPTETALSPYWLDWSGCNPGETPAWWTPSSDISQTYFFEGTSKWTFAKWEGGMLYVMAYNI